MEPPPTGVPAAPMTLEATDCPRASCCTSMPKDVALVVPDTLTDTAALLDDEANMPSQALLLASLAAESDSVDMSDLTCENTESWVCMDDATLVKLANGCFSNATSFETISSTGSWLPMPVDERPIAIPQLLNATPVNPGSIGLHLASSIKIKADAPHNTAPGQVDYPKLSSLACKT